jgi:hypothetical protein
MDAAKARGLAERMVPTALAHDRASDLGMTQAQIKAIDQNPADGQLTQEELYLALKQDRVKVDETTGRVTHVSAAFSFVDDKAGPGPREDLHQGYTGVATRDPKTQPMVGSSPGSYKPAAGMTLEQLTQRVTTPEQVTKLLQPFGSEIYDYERADKGTGPSGAQSPEYTLEARKGICRDSHMLGAYVLQQNGYNAMQTGYKAEGVMHAITTYEGKNGEGFGLIEYGTHYSPEKIKEILGRPALSHEEALQAVRPDAKLINLYSKPEAGKEGYIKSLYYTMGHMLYQDTLKLKHENSAEWSSAGGAKVEMALGEHWGIKLQADTGSSPDPTGRNAVSAAIGYQAGNEDNWMRVSGGVQYRPEEGHSGVGSNVWESHPATMLGIHAEGQVTPYKVNLGENHRLRTTINGDFTGALALTQGEGTNASGGKTDGKLQLNPGLMSGMNHATIRLGQHLEGKLTDHIGYRTEIFAAPDLMGMSLGYGTGGKGIYSNTGVNGSVHYNNGGFGAHVGAQKLFTQVNNLEATGFSSGMSYGKGPISLRLDGAMVESPEGWRMRTSQSVNVKVTKDVDAYGFAGQEQIYNNKYGHFKNDTGTNFGIGVRAKF